MNRRFPRRPSFRRYSGRTNRNFKSQGINHSLYINKAKLQPQESIVDGQITFQTFPFHAVLQESIVKKGYDNPTPIQTKTISHILEGKDVIGVSNTGTGKTGAFVLPLIQKILLKSSERVLILVPTRELAHQIREEISQFSVGMQIYSALCIGGRHIRDQIYQLRRNPHFVIATPGRLKDLISQSAVQLSTFHTVVLDEADRMVDMGFIHDITKILSLLPSERQSLCFSATISADIESIVQRFLKNPVTISVKTQNTPENVDQDIVRVKVGENKTVVLEELLRKKEFSRVLIFGRTKMGVERLSRQLNEKGFSATSIHGDKRQHQREQAIKLFKNQVYNILVATDVAARGIDIPDITHVINFDQPATYDDYIHRIGRTGRSNKKGFALTFV